ncbi:MAG: adenylyl-sulfate kinase [Candidatus Omnitrophica bacterium]|nr:adenylyl-sulfate kinase [Candidatus Omnitrophota bacterium]
MTSRALIFWFTGLSGSGKTTAAERAKTLLEKEARRVLILDGDDIRKRLHSDLGFGRGEIKENNARIAGLCDSERARYDVILVPIISPYAESRREARRRLEPGFYEIYFDADLETVMRRDVKGLYVKARRNELRDLIGYSPGAVYECPEKPDLIIASGRESAERSARALVLFIGEQLRNIGGDSNA